MVTTSPDLFRVGWLVYAVAGCLQGTLLVMCLFWRAQQRRLGIDDFGNPLPDAPSTAHFQHHVPAYQTGEQEQPAYAAPTVGAGTEVLPTPQREEVSEAVREAVETTPLLPGQQEGGKKKKFLGIFCKCCSPPSRTLS